MFLSCHYFIQVKNEQILRASYLFNFSVDKEKKLLNPGLISYTKPNVDTRSDSVVVETGKGKIVYGKHKKADSLSFLDRKEWAFQMYISFKNPNRAFTLDSLFQEELKSEGIVARTSVRLLQGDSFVGPSNKNFSQIGIALDPVVFGVDHDPKQIKLQAYVLFPYSYLISQMPLIWGLILLWCVSVILIYVWFRRKKKEGGEVIVANPLVQVSVVKHLPEVAEWEELAPGLFFNEKNGELKKKEHIIYLRKNRLLTFIKLLRAPDHFLNYEDICRDILERPLDDESNEKNKKWNQSVKKSMGQTITRLREDLGDFSEISIENVRDAGYQLNFKTVLSESEMQSASGGNSLKLPTDQDYELYSKWEIEQPYV